MPLLPLPIVTVLLKQLLCESERESEQEQEKYSDRERESKTHGKYLKTVHKQFIVANFILLIRVFFFI